MGLSLAPVVNPEGADLDEAFDPGQAHGFGDVDGAHHIDLQSGIDRVTDFAADQSRGVQHRVAFVFLNGFNERGQVTDVALYHGNIGIAQFLREKIFSRRDIIEDHVLAALHRVLRVRSADEPQAGDQRCAHVAPLRSDQVIFRLLHVLVNVQRRRAACRRREAVEDFSADELCSEGAEVEAGTAPCRWRALQLGRRATMRASSRPKESPLPTTFRRAVYRRAGQRR